MDSKIPLVHLFSRVIIITMKGVSFGTHFHLIYWNSMNINNVRKIDYWLGIPLCFLLSRLNHIQKAVSFKKKETKLARKILFIKLPELGAIILAYPLINCIRKEFASAELFFVTFDKNGRIFNVLGKIIPENNILEIRQSPALFVLDILKAIRRLRREKIDIIFDLDFFSRFTAIFSYLIRAGKSVGFYRYCYEGLYRGNFLTHKIQYNPLTHIARNYLSLGQAIRHREKNAPQLEKQLDYNELIFPQYISDSKIREKVLIKLRNLGVDAENNRLFLINPGEGVLSLREWPVESFIRLSGLILIEKNHYIVIIGTRGAREKSNYILKNINNPRCISMVDQTELDELMELFVVSNALISNDCGLAHLAMLAPINKFIIFGPESPHVFGPVTENSHVIYSDWPCSPCLSVFNNRNSSCSNNQCLKSIKPEYVFNLISKGLKKE